MADVCFAFPRNAVWPQYTAFIFCFPVITIALGWFLVLFQTAFNLSGIRVDAHLSFFWVKVFATHFCSSESGITIHLSLVLTGPVNMATVGNIAGSFTRPNESPYLAFFPRTTFFRHSAVWNYRVPPWCIPCNGNCCYWNHSFSILDNFSFKFMDAYPCRFEMRDGVAHAVDWWQLFLISLYALCWCTYCSLQN